VLLTISALLRLWLCNEWYLRLGDTDDGACVSTHTLGESGGMLSQKKKKKKLKLHFKYLYSNLNSSYQELVLCFFVAKSFRDRWAITVHVPAIHGVVRKGSKRSP